MTSSAVNFPIIKARLRFDVVSMGMRSIRSPSDPESTGPVYFDKKLRIHHAFQSFPISRLILEIEAITLLMTKLRSCKDAKVVHL
jgi:hypothetical protein